MLTGKHFWQINEALKNDELDENVLPTCTNILQDRGFAVGYTGKAFEETFLFKWKKKKHPLGKEYNEDIPRDDSCMLGKNYAQQFKSFFDKKGYPFFFWIGVESNPPLKNAEILPDTLPLLPDSYIPPYYPCTEDVRKQISAYYRELEALDEQLGEIFEYLIEKEQIDKTFVIITADNGMPFPRGRYSLYDIGTRVPLIIYCPDVIRGRRVVSDIIDMRNISQTIIDAADLRDYPEIGGESIIPLLTDRVIGRVERKNNVAYLGSETSVIDDPEEIVYPSRSIRTDLFLYIWNLMPEKWPSGNQNNPVDLNEKDEAYSIISRSVLDTLKNGNLPYKLCFAKRPEEELYQNYVDPDQMNNLAHQNAYAEIKNNLRKQLIQYLVQNGDSFIIEFQNNAKNKLTQN